MGVQIPMILSTVLLPSARLTIGYVLQSGTSQHVTQNKLQETTSFRSQKGEEHGIIGARQRPNFGVLIDRYLGKTRTLHDGARNATQHHAQNSMCADC